MVLVQEKRLDKNGNWVTRHVRVSDPESAKSGLRLPAPSVVKAEKRPEYKDLPRGRFIEDATARFDELGIPMEHNFKQLLKQISFDNDTCGGAAEKFYNLLPTLDAEGIQSLTGGGMNSLNLSDLNYHPGPEAQVLATAINAFEFSRVVDKATLPVPNAPVTKKIGIYETAVSFFWKQKVRCTADTSADLEAIYLFQSLGLNREAFPTAGDYYRGLTRLHAQREELKPYLPLLIALNTGLTTSKGYYFNEEYYLWENIDMVKRYPVDRIEAIALETIRRGDFDEAFANDIVNSNADSLNDGLL